MGNIQKYLANELLNEQKELKQKKTDNRTSELRKDFITRNHYEKRYQTYDGKKKGKSDPSAQGAVELDALRGRSRSVLPPIGGSIKDLKSISQRKTSL